MTIRIRKPFVNPWKRVIGKVQDKMRHDRELDATIAIQDRAMELGLPVKQHVFGRTTPHQHVLEIETPLVKDNAFIVIQQPWHGRQSFITVSWMHETWSDQAYVNNATVGFAQDVPIELLPETLEGILQELHLSWHEHEFNLHSDG